MCLIVFAYRQHSRYPLIVAANRDEFYTRPTRSASFWPETADLLAGRDLAAGGTWLGMTRTGRFAAVTNYRSPQDMHRQAPRSRGELTQDFLLSTESPQSYLEQLANVADQYAGFNLLLGDGHQLMYYSNRQRHIRPLAPGIYGLSNHLLDTPWPKVRRAKAALAEQLQHPQLTAAQLLTVMADTQQPADIALPDTGIGLTRERELAPCFIRGEHYGTRASTALLIDYEQRVSFTEWNYGPLGEYQKEKYYEFKMKPI